MEKTFLEFNRTSFPYIVLLYLALLTAHVFLNSLIFLNDLPFIFIGLGVILSGVFSIFDYFIRRNILSWSLDDFPRFLFTVYVAVLVGFFVSLIIYVYQNFFGVWLARFFSPGAWLSWAVILGIPAFLSLHQPESVRKGRNYWKIFRSERLQIFFSQGLAVLLGFFIYFRTIIYGSAAIVIAIFAGLIIFLTSWLFIRNEINSQGRLFDS